MNVGIYRLSVLPNKKIPNGNLRITLLRRLETYNSDFREVQISVSVSILSGIERLNVRNSLPFPIKLCVRRGNVVG